MTLHLLFEYPPLKKDIDGQSRGFSTLRVTSAVAVVLHAMMAVSTL